MPTRCTALSEIALSRMSLTTNLFYCVWDKPRAGKQQKQLHRVDRRKQMGVVELIQFLQQYTEPLALQAGPPENKKLFLYFSENTQLKHRLVSPCTAPRLSFRRVRDFCRRHRLPRFSLSQIRPSAATLLYLQTGGNLGKVQQFLQHAHLHTTVRYVLNSITESFNARVIQKAQERMVERDYRHSREAGGGREASEPAEGVKLRKLSLGASIRAAVHVVILTIRRSRAKRKGAHARRSTPALAAPMVSGSWRTYPWSLRLVIDSCVCGQR